GLYVTGDGEGVGLHPQVRLLADAEAVAVPDGLVVADHVVVVVHVDLTPAAARSPLPHALVAVVVEGDPQVPGIAAIRTVGRSGEGELVVRGAHVPAQRDQVRAVGDVNGAVMALEGLPEVLGQRVVGHRLVGEGVVVDPDMRRAVDHAHTVVLAVPRALGAV